MVLKTMDSENDAVASPLLVGREDPSMSGKDNPKVDDLEGASDPELEELLDSEE